MDPPQEIDELTASLAHMARDLLAQESVQDTLDRVVFHAVELVDGCEAAGILTVRSGRVHTLAASNDAVRESDRLQGQLAEGPCFDAARRVAEVYRAADLSRSIDRWPQYVPKARTLGIGSMMGFLLFTENDNLGALDMYAPQPDTFTKRSEEVGWVLASHAAVALAHAHRDAQLQQAVATRQDIGEAVGIVMERHKIPDYQAFDMLKKASQDNNVKLRQLARTVTETGEIPGPRQR